MSAPPGLFLSGSHHGVCQFGQPVKPAAEAMANLVLESVKAEQELREKQAGVAELNEKAAAGRAARAGISVLDIIQAGLIQPGQGVVTVGHKDVTYTADLLPSGQISYKGVAFDKPSAFSLHVKKLASPNKIHDEGWRCVHVNGVPLEDLRHRVVLIRAGQATKDGLSLLMPPAPAAPLGPDELPILPSDVDVKLPASEEEAEDADAEEPEHSNWVQCSRCETWRLVPDEFWPDIDAAGDEDWYCNEATWDVTGFEPYTEACK